MNWKSSSLLIVAIYVLGMLSACQTLQTVKEDNKPTSAVQPTMTEPTSVPESVFAPLP